MKSICIIPARGGSKRIPRKNIRSFCGKPMIAWSIAAASDSGAFSRIIVSTDDPEIAQVAREHGAEIPFMRPASLADDFTGTSAVTAHALRELAALGQAFDLACCIYATAPLLRPEDILRGRELLEAAPEALYAFSATSFPFPIQRAIAIAADGGVSMFQPEHMNTRSQDLPHAWHDAGQFYWGRPSAFLESKGMFLPHSRAVILPRHLVQDVDTEEDWLRLEALARALGHDAK